MDELNKATIIPDHKHIISKDNISKNALHVLHNLQKAGWQAYLVGGSVRDLLLGFKPKDFDIVTNAHPEQIRQLFRNSRLIGRRFRLVHVFYGAEIVEVATFRASTENEEGHRSQTGMVLRDNVYGTIEEDAWRRDLSINALFYNDADNTVVDFVGGMNDLKKKVIRIIGNPVERYHEDPVRMLRVVRFAAKLNFTIHPDTEHPIPELSGLLQNVAPPRLFEELLKLFYCGKAYEAFNLMRHYGLFALLFPNTEAQLAGTTSEQVLNLIKQALHNTDTRVANNQSLNPAFLFTVLLWWPLQNLIRSYQEQGMKLFPSLNLAMSEIIRSQLQHIIIPKRLTAMMREIWFIQYQLQQRPGRRIFNIFFHQRFKAAYDFLLLRVQAGEPLQSLVDWWSQFQAATPEFRQKMVNQLGRGRKRKDTRPT